MKRTILELLGTGDRLIMDPVHGGIALFKHEVQVIDHPLFQRLRNICQNDILSLVFPGATHSRFLHSIGTLHVGHRIYRALFENCLRNSNDNDSSISLLLASNHEENSQLIPAINYFYKLVRLACLLHDCGHSSFSHQFSKVPSIAIMLAAPELFNRLWSGIDYSDIYSQPPSELEHEHYSVRCAYEILSTSLCQEADIEANDVLSLMETTSCKLSKRFINYAKLIWPLFTGDETPHPDGHFHIQKLLRLIVSGEIDADRADYMLRDGFHSSVSLGGFNLDHLLKSLQVGWNKSDNWMGLAITHKGLGALEDFVYSRLQMYRKVYGHKTSIGFDWLLRKAIEEVLGQKQVSKYISQCLTDIDEFQYLTDSYFWEQFRGVAKKFPESYSAMMIHRMRVKPLHSIENLPISQIADKKRKVAEFNGIMPSEVVTCELRTRFSSIDLEFSDIMVLNRKPKGDGSGLFFSKIVDESQFFEKFNDGNIVHFYQDPQIKPIPFD